MEIVFVVLDASWNHVHLSSTPEAGVELSPEDASEGMVCTWLMTMYGTKDAARAVDRFANVAEKKS